MVLKKLTKIVALSASQRRTLATALALLPVFWLALRVVGFKRLVDWVGRAPARSARRLSFEQAAAVGGLVNSAAHHVLGPENCLVRSLCLQWLLRRRGVASELRIGARRVDGRLESHAWIEVAGRPVNDAPDVAERFAAFDHALANRAGVAP